MSRLSTKPSGKLCRSAPRQDCYFRNRSYLIAHRLWLHRIDAAVPSSLACCRLSNSLNGLRSTRPKPISARATTSGTPTLSCSVPRIWSPSWKRMHPTSPIGPRPPSRAGMRTDPPFAAVKLATRRRSARSRSTMRRWSALAMLRWCHRRWSDLGSWNEIWSRAPRDTDGNALQGNALAVDTTGSLVISGETTVATLGLNDVVVVAVDGAVLVSVRDRAGCGSVGQGAEGSRQIQCRPYQRGASPVGSYRITDRDPRFQTKRIIVRPGAKLLPAPINPPSNGSWSPTSPK